MLTFVGLHVINEKLPGVKIADQLYSIIFKINYSQFLTYEMILLKFEIIIELL